MLYIKNERGELQPLVRATIYAECGKCGKIVSYPFAAAHETFSMDPDESEQPDEVQRRAGAYPLYDVRGLCRECAREQGDSDKGVTGISTFGDNDPITEEFEEGIISELTDLLNEGSIDSK